MGTQLVQNNKKIKQKMVPSFFFTLSELTRFRGHTISSLSSNST